MNSLITTKNNIFESQKKIFLIIFFLSVISRAITAYFFGDKTLQNEWLFLVSNLYNHDTFSLINFGDLFIPNLWMPPIYGYFIYIHALIFGLNENLASHVIVTQIFLSSLTPLIFYRLISKFFDKKLSGIGAIFFSLFPLIVYSPSQISSATIYLFLLLTFIDQFLNLSNQKNIKLNIVIGLLAGILILTRRDFLLIYFFSVFYSLIFFKIDIKKLIFICLVSLITISPYLARNYIIFEKLILHSGFGYNVWKAYNPEAKVEGYYIQSEELKQKIDKVEKNIFYRINEDKVYLDQAIEYIKENPKKYISLFVKRLISFFFVDLESTQKNYYNFFHIVPNFLISLISLFGLIVFPKKDKKYIYLMLVMFLLIFIYSLFALLPRYKVYVIPFQLILTISFFDYLKNKLSKNY